MNLFSMWDTKVYGKLKVRVLVENFIALGLAANEKTALHFFRGLVISGDSNSNMKTHELLESWVSNSQFAALFDSDSYSLRMLDQVNKEANTLTS